ncbi:ubiquitin-conjugating enzyme/RWD-like protein [Cercophora scortea]|uniref:E2 ubiquitin-conjugating enzyme n=1 Tax=Cercophora scortea TaxID=314031 RepID=A0AAE0IEX0_9PEZI|nr:ubiquitin-conjugating enzyme/RWD-like protein [Cercophora scortea]
MASQKRISKELADCSASPPAGMSITLASDSDVHKWHITLDGPVGSAYAGGRFGLIVSLPTDYPFKPPVVTFATRIYHPNVTNDATGAICLGLLKPEQWKPSTRVQSVLEAVRALLVEPNPDDPLESRIADEYRANRAEFNRNARAYVNKYATGPVTFSSAAAAGSAAGSGSGSGDATGGKAQGS